MDKLVRKIEIPLAKKELKKRDFASLTDETPLEEEELLKADEIYVYTSRMDQAEVLMEGLMEYNPELDTKEKIRELLYCDLYRLN